MTKLKLVIGGFLAAACYTNIAIADESTATGTGMSQAQACNAAMTMAENSSYHSGARASSKHCGECSKDSNTNTWSCVGYATFN